MAGGIGEALVCTAAGLCVAIPAYVFHRYFRGRVADYVVEMETPGDPADGRADRACRGCGAARTARPRRPRCGHAPARTETRLRCGSVARRNDDFEINVISLIDVLLTLLMFFVHDHDVRAALAHEGDVARGVETASEAQREALIVMVDRDGHYFIDNNEVLNPALDTLKEAIARIAGDNRERPVVLRADAMTPHQAVVTAMDALGQLGFTHLSIATTRAKDAAREAGQPMSDRREYRARSIRTVVCSVTARRRGWPVALALVGMVLDAACSAAVRRFHRADARRSVYRARPLLGLLDADLHRCDFRRARHRHVPDRLRHGARRARRRAAPAQRSIRTLPAIARRAISPAKPPDRWCRASPTPWNRSPVPARSR